MQFIEDKHCQAKIGPNLDFSFKYPQGFIELKFGTSQKKPYDGWTIEPLIKPSIVCT